MQQTEKGAWLRGAVRAGATALRLVGPVLVPSWRFFDVVGPSPRIEYAFQHYASTEPAPERWQALVFTPPRVSLLQMLWRLVFNAERNDVLFLVSCCERVLEGDESPAYAVAQQEILLRVLQHATRAGLLTNERWLRFRILEVRRVGVALCSEQAFISDAFVVADIAAGVPVLRTAQARK